MGVEISVRVQPQHPQFLAGVAAMARHRADRADAQAVVAAQQDGQLALAQFGMHRVVHRAVPGGHFRQMAVAVDGGCQGLAGPYRLPRSSTSKPWASMTGPRPATRRASGPMEAPRAGADVGGRSDQRCRAAGKGWSAWRFSARADSGKERQNQAADGAAGPAPAWPAWWTHLSAVAPRPHCHGVTEGIAMARRAFGAQWTESRQRWRPFFHIHAHDPLVPAPSFLPAAARALAAMACALPLPSRSRCASAWFRPWPTRRPRKPSRWPPGKGWRSSWWSSMTGCCPISRWPMARWMPISSSTSRSCRCSMRAEA